MTAMPNEPIEVQLRLARPGFTLDIDVRLPGQGVSALFGPSGCGKTTCLRAVAGLERAPQGRVVVAGEVWQDEARKQWLPTHRRALGYVFQEASLFPHLSVRGNVEYGLRRLPAQRRRIPLEQALELLGLQALLARAPATLSGGERQRVAIARALATSPRLLLMDEPLAALDAARKAEVLPYLERLQRELHIPILYVSHAPDEVARLAQHLVLLRAGQVLACGPTLTLMTRLDLPLSEGDGAAVPLQATIVQTDTHDQVTTVETAIGTLHLVGMPTQPPGHRVLLRVQARDVSLSLDKPQRSSVLNIIAARVAQLRPDGPGQVMVALHAGHATLLARVTQRSANALALQAGQPVYAHIKGVALLS